MNRLAPLITRRVGPSAPLLALPASPMLEARPDPAWLDDLKLFATGWIGGLVFFGTLLA